MNDQTEKHQTTLTSKKTEDICIELQTIRDYIRFAYSTFSSSDLFYGHGSDNAWDESVFLVFGSLDIPWDGKEELLDARLLPFERENIITNVRKRVLEKTPLPYILNKSYYMGLCFFVDPRVLIPRSPISELIEQGFAPWADHSMVSRILDLCTGSGCIGISCAYEFEHAQVVLSDLSPDAIEVAEKKYKKVTI